MKFILLLVLSFFITKPLYSKEASFLPKTFKVEFSQVQKSSISGKIKESKGVLDYKYPGHLKFETKEPNNIILISNPKKTWLYRPALFEGEKGEVKVSKSNKNSLVDFFDLLKKGLVSNSKYKVKKTKDNYLLTFDKKQLGIISAEIKFKGKPIFKNITNIFLKKVDKSVLRFKFNKVNESYSFKKDYFVFKIPKNARISH